MSKILRRPMFRGGGPVSSYGSGITAPLVDGYAYGGNINTPRRGLVSLPGGYGGLGDEIRNDFGNLSSGISGGSIAGLPKLTLGSELMAMNNIPPSMRYQEEDKEDKEDKRTEDDKVSGTASERNWASDGLDYLDVTDAELGYNTDTIYEGDKWLTIDGIKVQKKNTKLIPKNTDGSYGPVIRVIDEEKADGITNYEFDQDPEVVNNKELYESPTMTMKQAEMNQGNVMPGVEVNEGEVVIQGGGEDEGIQSMADEYFKLMGGEKARGKDISDMLLRFAGSQGDTVGEKFQNYAAAEAKVKSRTEGLKEKASGFAIQQDAQMKLLQKKLDSAESIADKNLIAAEMRALNKQYSPPVTQKDINYGKSLKKGSADHTLYLREKKLKPTLEAEINNKVQMGTAMGVGEINALGPIYYDNWQGIFKEGVSEDDGRYLDVANQEIIYFEGGKEISKTKITLTQ